MIFLKFSDDAMRLFKLPKLVAYNCDSLDAIRRVLVYSSISIFTFKDGLTVYLKDRLGDAYQYTPEEQIFIILSTQLK